MDQTTNIRYDVYLRKSSEAEDKQVQSIDDQRREMREFVAKNGLNVLAEFDESQSAHHPGRPVFDEVMKRIEKGISNGLLVWHANRVSRNPVDSGTVIHLIDEGNLIHVRTPSHIYGNTSTEKMMLALECMIAKKDSDDKSDAVKRGLRGRYKKGLPNGVAPLGFINDLSHEKGDRGWLVDTERFPLVRQLLELFNSRKYSSRALLKIANEDMGLRTMQRKKQGGRKLHLSYLMDTILKNPIYAGFFQTKDGERHELDESLPRAVSEEKYWENQKILGEKGRPRPSKNKLIFAYTGLTECGGCGGAVTAEHKYQVICDCKHKFPLSNRTHCPACGLAIKRMNKPVYLHYIYYHCTRTKDPNCREGSVQELYIDNYLASYFRDNFKISKALHDWCLENLETADDSQAKNDSEKKVSLEATLAKKKKEYKELVLMKAKGLIEDDDFISLKGTLKEEIGALERAMGNLGQAAKQAKIKEAKRAFELSLGIDEIFKNGSPQEKKELMLEIGSNLTIKAKKLDVYNTGVYAKIINGLLTAKAENPSFEPEKSSANKDKTEVFSSVCPTLLRR
jgi:site-specific DNA recombinase